MTNKKSHISRYSLARLMMKKPSLMLSALGIYVGAGMIYLGINKIQISQFLLEEGWVIMGGVVITISFFYLFVASMKMTREDRFIDIDDRINLYRDNDIVSILKSEIDELKKSKLDVDINKFEELIKKSIEPISRKNKASVKSFEDYFELIKSTLEEKASIADQKASILLDKGTLYSKGGILFFISSIAIWQLLSWAHGFEQQFIYGIASCSILFIFIEFLSAWFLKQYRQFVDTSTYLIKVKSIFDKYMLAYLVIKEVPGDNKERLYEMLGILKEDIKWPETYLLKNGDISFAKETVEALGYFMKNMKEMTRSRNQ